MPMLPTQQTFVGRQHEMYTLVSALDDAVVGRGRLVMLVGEPGIGKTRTAREIASIATSSRGEKVRLMVIELAYGARTGGVIGSLEEAEARAQEMLSWTPKQRVNHVWMCAILALVAMFRGNTFVVAEQYTTLGQWQ